MFLAGTLVDTRQSNEGCVQMHFPLRQVPPCVDSAMSRCLSDAKLGADFLPHVSARASRSRHGRREGCLRMPTLAAGSRDPLEAQIARAHDEVVLEEWAPARYGIAPHIRIGKRWFNVLWLLPIGFVALILA